MKCPISFAFYARHSFNGVEEMGSFIRVFNVGVNEERIRLGMNVFYHDLKAVKTSGLGDLNFSGEAFHKVFIHDAVRSCEERKDVRDEMSLACIELVPVPEVMREVNFFGRPERGLGFFVKRPYLDSLSAT
jgi:hypothetical protein